MRVLVVDDDPGLRQSLALLLNGEGYEVVGEGSPVRALELGREERFDLVLCDVRMPEMEGLEFLRRYQQAGGGALVIMMSAYGGQEAAIAAMKEGAYDYLPSRSGRTRSCSRSARRRSGSSCEVRSPR